MSKSTIVTIAIFAGIALYSYFTTANRNDSGQIESAGSMDVFALRVGDCTNDGTSSEEGEEISSVTAIPCTEPHDNEFYATTNMTMAEFPGEEAVLEEAAQYCLDVFESHFEIPYPDSVLEITYIYPTESGWDELDDREILCAAYHMEGEKLVGLARGI